MSAIPLHLQRRFEQKKMGISFQPTGCGKRTEESRFESHASYTNGSPRRAAKAKESPADVKLAAY